MKCQNCDCENSDGARFCKKCGASLTDSNDKNKINNRIIIVLIAVVVIVLAGVLLYASGVFNSNTSLEAGDFEGFDLDVPVGSNFVLKKSHNSNPDNLFVQYNNNGEHSEIVAFQVGNNLSEDKVTSLGEFVEASGDLRIYRNGSDNDGFYMVFKEGVDANIIIYGGDLDILKAMADSFKCHNFSVIYDEPEASQSTPETSEVSSTHEVSGSGALSIISGSISTGSGLSDKTHARVFVGTAHSGEHVKIQVFYSRDGEDLNKGNIVDKTVDSNGYIEVARAKAFKYYPDHAEINIYDKNMGLLDYLDVGLKPESGTQTF